MKKFVLILSLLISILIFSCTSYTEKENKHPFIIPTSRVVFTAKIDSSFTNDSTKQVFIKVSLNNKTFQSIEYLSMSCSWLDGFTTDANEFKIYNDHMCFSNVLILDSIPAFKSNSYNILLTAKKTTSETGFRIGLNFIESNKLNYRSQYDSLTNMKHIIWSNPVEVK